MNDILIITTHLDKLATRLEAIYPPELANSDDVRQLIEYRVMLRAATEVRQYAMELLTADLIKLQGQLNG